MTVDQSIGSIRFHYQDYIMALDIPLKNQAKDIKKNEDAGMKLIKKKQSKLVVKKEAVKGMKYPYYE